VQAPLQIRRCLHPNLPASARDRTLGFRALWAEGIGLLEVAAGTEVSWNPLGVIGKDERIVPRFVDKPFEWVTILALASGAAVLVPSLAALGMTLVAVILKLV
jgi:hypothetical protein